MSAAAAPGSKQGFDFKPFVPSIIMGQLRKRLLASLPEDQYRYTVLASALAGSAQAAVALYLKAPSALEKRPEEMALVVRSKRDFKNALIWTMIRNAAGFVVFFAVLYYFSSTTTDIMFVVTFLLWRVVKLCWEIRG
jgi:hypothetical protein